MWIAGRIYSPLYCKGVLYDCFLERVGITEPVLTDNICAYYADAADLCVFYSLQYIRKSDY